MMEVDTIQCCKAEDLLTALPDDCIDMILTSPPYDNLRTYKGFSWDFELIARQSYRVLKPGGVLVWVVGDATVDGCETLTGMRHALYFVDVIGFKLDDTMIYEKAGTTPQLPVVRYSQDHEFMFVFAKGYIKTRNVICESSQHPPKFRTRRRDNGSMEKKINGGGPVPMSNIWHMGRGYMVSTPDKIAYEHPAMFPEELARRHILTWSNSGDLVLDYFGGSGTTAKIARQLGRHYITCDISPEYCDLMKRRLSMPYTPPLFDENENKPPQGTQGKLFE